MTKTWHVILTIAVIVVAYAGFTKAKSGKAFKMK